MIVIGNVASVRTMIVTLAYQVPVPEIIDHDPNRRASARAKETPRFPDDPPHLLRSPVEKPNHLLPAHLPLHQTQLPYHPIHHPHPLLR